MLCRTDPDAPKHKGLSYLLVDMKSPGVTVRPLMQITGEHGFNQVFFEDVVVPKANLVGQKNQGWMVAMTNMMFERTIHGGRTDMMVEVRQLGELAKQVAAQRPSRVGGRLRAQRIARLRLRSRGAQVHELSPADAPAQGTAARPRRLR